MINVYQYESTNEPEWDNFVMGKDCVNGTFLQSRNFLNYHPQNRFQDCSLLFRNEKGKLVAVCPGCRVIENEKAVFYSHKGSTFGGLVIHRKYYTAAKVIEIINALEKFLQMEGYHKILLKITPDIFSSEKSDLLQYALSYSNYLHYSELSTYIDFNRYNNNILSNFKQGKRTNVNNCIKEGLYYKSLDNDNEIHCFYTILCENLQKFGTLPIHTVEELFELKRRLNNDCNFGGVFLNENMVAGTMTFSFPQSGCVHTQYLSSKQDFNRLSPMTFLYYSIIKEAKEKGAKYLSWGISTEDKGKVLNFGLIKNKEFYGSKYSLNRTFFKEIV